MGIKPGDKWAPLGLSTQEAVSVVVSEVKEFGKSLTVKLDGLEDRIRDEIIEAGVGLRGPDSVGEPNPERLG